MNFNNEKEFQFGLIFKSNIKHIITDQRYKRVFIYDNIYFNYSSKERHIPNIFPKSLHNKPSNKEISEIKIHQFIIDIHQAVCELLHNSINSCGNRLVFVMDQNIYIYNFHKSLIHDRVKKSLSNLLFAEQAPLMTFCLCKL